MNEEQLKEMLRRETAAREQGPVPGFTEVFSNAEAQVRQSRSGSRYAFGLVAATAMVAIVANLVPQQPDWRYVDPMLLAESTSWEAPSDVLLPEHSVDIFDDIPVFIEGTEIDEGALL